MAPVAKLCFAEFVRSFSQIYGTYLVSHNVHGLLRVFDDYERFGYLDEYSCFPFENFLYQLKNTLRKSDKPLQQIVKRYYESLHTDKQKQTTSKENIIFKHPHRNGPVLSSHSIESQYSVCNIKGITLKKFSSSIRDCYIITKDSKIVEVRNITKNSEGDIIFFGYYFQSQSDFWKVSNIGSSCLNIHEVSELSTDLKAWKQCELLKKCLVLTFSGKKIAIPIMHTCLN